MRSARLLVALSLTVLGLLPEVSSVRIVDESGFPIAGVKVRVQGATANSLYHSDSNGEISIEQWGLLVVDAESPDGVAKRGTGRVVPGVRSQSLTVRPANASLVVTLMDQDRSPIRGGEVACAFAPGGARLGTTRAQTDENGLVTLTGLFPGPYLVTWYVEGGGFIAKEVAVYGATHLEMGPAQRTSEQTAVLPHGNGRYQLMFCGEQETVVTPLLPGGTSFSCDGWVVPGDYLLMVREEDTNRQSAYVVKYQNGPGVAEYEMGGGRLQVVASCQARAYIMVYCQPMRARPILCESFMGKGDVVFEGLTQGVYDCVVIAEQSAGWELNLDSLLSLDGATHVQVTIADKPVSINMTSGPR